MRAPGPVAAVTGALALALPIAVATARARQPQTSPSKPLVPAAASSILADPDAHYGLHVTLVGAVDEHLSDTAFTVDQDPQAHSPKSLLVLVPRLYGPLDLNSYVTVIGEVIRFEPDHIGQLALAYPLDLPAHTSAKYGGGPAVLATSVITAGLVDLARKPLEPLTPAEAAFDAAMKRTGSAFAALRDAQQDGNTAACLEQTAVLKETLGEAETFWRARGKPDAAGYARQAKAIADAIERDAGAGRWEEVRRSSASLSQACQRCHAAYRERLEDGGYRIKR